MLKVKVTGSKNHEYRHCNKKLAFA